MTQERMIEYAILKIAGRDYYEDSTSLAMLLPEHHWKKISQDDYSILLEYLREVNMKLTDKYKCSGMYEQYYIIVKPRQEQIESDIEEIRKIVEARRAAAELEKQKRKERAARAKATREKNKRAKELEQLQKLQKKYGKDK